MATAVTAVTSRTAARTTSSPSATPAIAIATAAGTSTTVTSTFRTRGASLARRNHSVYAVEVRLVIRIEVRASFDYRRRSALRN